jgi:type VI secretion system ImpM family protein
MKMFSSASGPRRDETAGSLADAPRPEGAWLFGKIPAHGDFISRGLPPALHEALDLWLSAELAGARTRFADFDHRYQSAAPWHFVDRDPAGAWSGGALCPSVDAVGRRFPILVAAPAVGAAEAEAVARAALELVFAALGEAWDAGRLHAALSEIAAIPAESAPAQAVWAIEAEDGTRIEMPGRFPQGLVERMLELAE